MHKKEKKAEQQEQEQVQQTAPANDIEEQAPTAQPEPEQKDLAAEQAEQLKAAEDKYLRLYAEFENYRKRTCAEREDLAKYAAGNLIKEFLPVMDSFERAKGSFEKHTEDVEELKKGLALIHKQFEDTLERVGVKKIVAKGEKFNPNLHEAVMQQEAEGVAAEMIIEEMQPGFMLHEKVLRHSMVIVAK